MGSMVGMRLVAGNAIWSLLAFLLRTGVMILTIPLFIHFLGPRDFGIWTLAYSILEITSVLHLGLGDATIKFVAEYMGREEPVEATRVIYATFILYSIIGVISTTILWFLSSFLAIHTSNLTPPERNHSTVIFKIMSLAVTPNFSMTAVTGVFSGLQKFHISQGLSILRSWALSLLGIVVLYFGFGLYGLAVVTVSLVWTIWLLGFGMVIWQIRTVRFQRLCLKATLKKVLSFSLYTMLGSLGVIALNSIDKILVAACLGLEAVTYYVVPKNAAIQLHSCLITGSQALMPYFSYRNSTCHDKDLSVSLMASWRIVLLSGFALAALALASAPWALRVWMGKAFALKTIYIYLVFVVAFSCDAINIVPTRYLNGKGRADIPGWTTVIAAAAVLLGILIIAPHLGTLGAAMSWLIFPITRISLSIYTIKTTPGISWSKDFLSELFLPVFYHGICATVGMISGIVLVKLTGLEIAGLFGSLALCGVSIIIVYLVSGTSTNQFFLTAWLIADKVMPSYLSPYVLSLKFCFSQFAPHRSSGDK